MIDKKGKKRGEFIVICEIFYERKKQANLQTKY